MTDLSPRQAISSSANGGHSHSKDENNIFSPGTMLEHRWEIIRLIGKGSFSEIYEARDHLNEHSPLVAIKAASKSVESKSIVNWESTVMSRLSDVSSIPRVYKSSIEGAEYFGMELLTGEDMSKLRNRIRDVNPTKLIPINIASYFARQMVGNLQEMHKRGYVHRDVKPSNFIRKNKKSNLFYTIDFGLAKMYRDENGNVRQPQGTAEFRGTTIYASPFTHHGLHQCPRDDIIGVIHVFLDMTCGILPWGKEARNRDKTKVIEIKDLCYDQPKEFVHQLKKATMEAEKHHNIQMTNFPPCAQEKIESTINYLRVLEYDSVIDYNLIQQYLLDCVPQDMDNNVADINFKCSVFSWLEDILPTASTESKKRPQTSGDVSPITPSNNTPLSSAQHPPIVALPPSAPFLMNSDPIAIAVRNLTTRVVNLRSSELTFHHAKTVINNNSNTGGNNNGKVTMEQRAAAGAIRWRNCFVELMKLPAARITEELLSAMSDILRINSNFFAMHISSWSEFEMLQLDIMKFYKLQVEVKACLTSSQDGISDESPALKKMKSHDENHSPDKE